MYMAYDWRVVVIEKFLVLHYIENASLRLVVHCSVCHCFRVSCSVFVILSWAYIEEISFYSS